MADGRKAAFSWTPHARKAARALELPQQLSRPLRHRRKLAAAAGLPDALSLIGAPNARLQKVLCKCQFRFLGSL